MPIPYCFDYYGFVKKFEIGDNDACNSVLAQDCFVFIRVFYGSIYFLGSFCFFEKCPWNFVRNCIESVDCFGCVGIFFFFFFFFKLFRATAVAYESSQARGQISTVDASLHHSHSNAKSELCL